MEDDFNYMKRGGIQDTTSPKENVTLDCITGSDLVNLVESWVNDNPLSSYNGSNCSYDDVITFLEEEASKPAMLIYGRLFYAYFMPVVFVVGVIGNVLSINVFLSRNMRGLSGSKYILALSASDIAALVFYVLVEWLKRGLPFITHNRVMFMDITGICHGIFYFQYASRFFSAWLVVAFTLERFIGVCHPLRRRDICTEASTRRIICGLIVTSLVISIYKPALSVVQDVTRYGRVCTTDPRHQYVTFVLDSIYAVFIALVPFVFITVLNLMIVRKLVMHNKRNRLRNVVTAESVIRLEFTLILLAISICFVIFNVPYFVVWCKLFLTSKFVQLDEFEDIRKMEFFQGIFWITRAIFCFNYCINFFLYSITGAYFRQELKMLFMYNRKTSQLNQPYCRCRFTSNRSTVPSVIT
ncbi:probable G-protein coupled receptor 139 [Patella vulgata]|uniref:probable G-protein coupled receptor 139 n=1 Tax=Patella vulgata TaxID=6465 RepID=UPI00218021F9|nr:probable G-protein coupled receptor 139 [Patella vulgata]